jgi:hypothetical protein
MDHMNTDTYPTRYAAFDNPRTWVDQSLFTLSRRGCELSVYHEPITNAHYPHIEDGIYVVIYRYQGIGYLLDCQMTVPTQARRQLNMSQRYDTYDEAKRAALEWLRMARGIYHKLSRRD